MKTKTAALILLSALTAGCATPRFPSKTVTPPYLREGDTVGIVSVSFRIAPDADTARIREIFRNWGMTVKFGRHLLDQTDPAFGARDADRAADLQSMIEDPAVKAVVMFNGGYGAVRTLDFLDLKKLRKQPKWIVGYSDMTMLHNAIARQGVQSIHGTVPVSFSKDSIDSSMLSLRDALTGRTTVISTTPHPLNQKGTAVGTLTGGNLSLIYAAAGTDYDNTLRRGDWVLLIEDLSEQMYALDRMMQNLYRSGKLGRVKAILVGHLTNIRGQERFDITPEELIARYARQYDIPVIFGFPVGHEQPNDAVYLGRKVRVTVTNNTAQVDFLK